MKKQRKNCEETGYDYDDDDDDDDDDYDDGDDDHYDKMTQLEKPERTQYFLAACMSHRQIRVIVLFRI
jgi:hypothetical protein